MVAAMTAASPSRMPKPSIAAGCGSGAGSRCSRSGQASETRRHHTAPVSIAAASGSTESTSVKLRPIPIIGTPRASTRAPTGPVVEKRAAATQAANSTTRASTGTPASTLPIVMPSATADPTSR